MKHEEALRKAVEALEHIKQDRKVVPTFGLIAALKEAQPREWVGLTFQEQQEAILNTHSTHEAIMNAEKKLKEKNGA